MKKNQKSIIKLIAFSCIFTAFVSCASNSKSSDYTYQYDDEYSDYENEPTKIDSINELNENFIADIDPVYLEPVYFLTKNGKAVKPKEIRKIAFIPRTNAVEIHFRDLANEICIILNKAEREKILEACNKFLEEYDAKTLKHQKVNSKTAYFKSTCSLWFGLLSPNMGCEKNEYYINYEFINKRPYLLYHFMPSRCTGSNTDNFTPKVTLYMSPSQIRDFIEQMDQKNLEATIQTIKEKAYTY